LGRLRLLNPGVDVIGNQRRQDQGQAQDWGWVSLCHQLIEGIFLMRRSRWRGISCARHQVKAACASRVSVMVEVRLQITLGRRQLSPTATFWALMNVRRPARPARQSKPADRADQVLISGGQLRLGRYRLLETLL